MIETGREREREREKILINLYYTEFSYFVPNLAFRAAIFFASSSASSDSFLSFSDLGAASFPFSNYFHTELELNIEKANSREGEKSRGRERERETGKERENNRGRVNKIERIKERENKRERERIKDRERE